MTTIPIEHNWSAEQWDWPLQHQDGVVKVHNTPDSFEVGLELSYFTPKEIDIKIMGNEVVIHCSHETRSDKHGSITREVHRSYHLPLDVDTTTLKSHLGKDGVLHLTASKKK